MNAPISPEVTDALLRQRFADVFARIAETAVVREQQRELAHEAVGWLRAAGFGALRVPVAQGGPGGQSAAVVWPVDRPG